MSNITLDELTRKLAKTGVCDDNHGVSFRGNGLKLNNTEDCKDVVEAIKTCNNLTYLDLEGNTLGVDAAREIAEALKEKKELRRALWKDLFTGRMKTEIPKALAFLGNGLTTAGAKLSELDLSDNAFGPIGVEALASLLSSPACYQLEELRLNNNGLGITGGKMLAEALLNCHKNSTAAGQPFALKVFIAGRNRLENEGATALSKVFETLGSLEEIAMPQNGIYHKGISKISNALIFNRNLRILNLNDNTITPKGAECIAFALRSLQKLQVLNLGDCLLKSKGAVLISDALSDGHPDLEEVQLESNEIRKNGGMSLALSLKGKTKLKKLCLGGNEFGEAGRAVLKEQLGVFHMGHVLDCPSDDDQEASGSEDEEDDDDDDDDDDDEENEKDVSQEKHSPPKSQLTPKNGTLSTKTTAIVDQSPVGRFLTQPNAENLVRLQSLGPQGIMIHFKDSPETLIVDEFVHLIMKVSHLTSTKDEEVKKLSRTLAIALYKALFEWAEKEDKLSVVNNILFVYLGLIKDEDKEANITWDIDLCINVLQAAIVEKIVPNFTQHILTCCLDRKFKKKIVEEITVV